MSIDLYDARQIIADVIGGDDNLSEDLTLLKIGRGELDVNDPMAGRSEDDDAEYTCRGIVDITKDPHGTYAAMYGQQGVTNRRDENTSIIILGGTLDEGIEPESGDKITDSSGRVWIIAGKVTSDPAQAHFACPCRPA